MLIHPAPLWLLIVGAAATTTEMDATTGMVMSATLSSKFQTWDNVRAEWGDFKKLFNKKYDSDTHDVDRLKIWLDNWEHIVQHNKLFKEGKSSFEVEMTEYGDLSMDEFQKRNGLIHDQKVADEMRKLNKKHVAAAGSDLILGASGKVKRVPDSIDWRREGRVNKVLNQGKCGACYAFASTAALEAQIKRFYGYLPKLSEQDIIDCSRPYGNKGCVGGLMDKAYKYIWKEKVGLESELNYPYEYRADKPCRYKPSRKAKHSHNLGYAVIRKNDEYSLKDAVATVGPIAVAIDAHHRSLQFYKSGVFYDPACSSKHPNHAMLIVGYGNACNEAGEVNRRACQQGFGEYWTIKNTWGAKWGEEGYFRLARNKGSHCCVALHGVYPLMKLEGVYIYVA